jgi:membrane associated rhomboid family serine protease
MFLHGSLLHIALNLYSLYQMGPAAEVHFGSSNFGTIYIVSGVGGICCSLLCGGHVSVGASTCLFGILGAVLAAKVFACRDWRRAAKNSDVRRTAFWIALNFALIGLAFPNVDNWGHLGGLLMGFVYGGLFEYWREHHRVGLALILSIVLFTAAGVAACRWMVFNPHYHVHLALRADAEGRIEEAQRQFEEARDWARIWRSEAAGRELYRAAFDAQSGGDYGRRDALLGIMEDVAPASFVRDVLGMP